MQPPRLSEIAESAEASAIRSAQEAFRWRSDNRDVNPLNLAIGNVSLPAHQGMLNRARDVGADHHPLGPLKKGSVPYTATVGTDAARAAILNVIGAPGFDTEGLYSHITAGGTGAMELMIRACCEKGRPLMLIEPYYTNYKELADKVGVPTTSVSRTLQEDGKFSLPDLEQVRAQIRATGANALVVIPYDNPSGQFLPQNFLNELARICIEANVWMIGDEAYRGLVYTGEPPSSIWGITEKEVPGIKGRRVGIESASKVFNACGVRMGALVTDNQKLHQQAVKLATPELCASVLGQHMIEALNEESQESIVKWIEKLRTYYKNLIAKTAQAFRDEIPGLVVSSPDASIYFVIDFRKILPDFDAKAFVNFCAAKGKVDSVPVNGKPGTLFLAPMGGFYSNPESGRTQMRVAAVSSEDQMLLAPKLCAELLKQYERSRGQK